MHVITKLKDLALQVKNLVGHNVFWVKDYGSKVSDKSLTG
jgi:hypothetical protein